MRRRELAAESLRRAARKFLLAALRRAFPLIGSDAVAPSQVRLKVGTPFRAVQAALRFFVLLLLLERCLRIPVAISLRVGRGRRKRQGSRDRGARCRAKSPEKKHASYLARVPRIHLSRLAAAASIPYFGTEHDGVKMNSC